ncbi:MULTISPECIES: non-ribosomal peptide synthetase [unclassified Amycolatopsis]|uniref:non-ribosomal peptide synthetase n=1 Tax=unclassified Amycolatopsis TaxID=2618356 RepID=UPI00106EFFD6|nr:MULTISPECIES: non-ribosomal peptide synthetase [unclassified Amycolatopsis]
MTAVETSLPLSTAQTDVWFDEQLSGGGLAYAMADYLDITGDLDVPVFVEAFRLLTDEAECFRARFFEVDGEPRQVVEPLTELPVSFLDLSGEPDPEAAALAWMHEDLARPFSVSDFPLFRAALLTLGPRRRFWYLTTHHLVGDGFSAAICHRRMGELYTAVLTGKEPEGRPLPPFRDLLESELAYQNSTHLGRDREFWSSHFSTVPDLISLSGKEPAPARGFLRRTLALPADAAAAARKAVAQAGVTLPTFLLAAMAAYTERLSGIQDLMLTVPVAARAGVRTRTIPGMMANYLPLKMQVTPAMTPQLLLKQASRELARTLKHQRYHVNQIRRDIGVRSDERRPFGGPFVNVLPADPGLRLGDCVTRVRNLSTGITNDLSITVLDEPGGGIELHLNGNPDLYDESGVDTHLHRFAGFLDRFARADPDAPLARIDVADAREREELLAAGLGASGPVGAGVVERVRAQAPDAVAVVDAAGAVSYADLVGMASALSRRLSTGRVVGVLAGPGSGFISAVLGVLGAGGAYVPLDPTLPLARLRDLVADSGAACVLAAPEFQELAAELPVDVVELDGTVDPELVPVVGEDDDVAYVIFTSGSTGRPKGAMVSRLGMMNHLLAKVEDLRLGASDVVVQNAPLTFDVSVWQMLAPLVVGGQVRVVDRQIAADPETLFGLGMSVLEVVPSLLRAALDFWDAGGPPELAGLRWLVVTGEALPPDLCVRWFGYFPQIPLVNAYGPTECSDDVTHAVLSSVDDVRGLRTPIGLPVRNTRLYVLSDELRPVPAGAAGELYVGGLVVGRGYVGDPGKTGSVFVADPFGEPGTRMYRTGDRVVRRADGALEFIERRDFQVKIRGHRIELGEIEATLRELPEIADAVVVVRDDAGTKRLAAYLVGTEPVDVPSVRSELQQRLPDYLVPPAMVVLDAMPLTVHGKVDRDALPEPDFAAEAVGRSPRNAVEAILCDVLAEVLTVPKVYIDDNFFALGGDSVSSIQVVSRARKAGLVITPRDLLEARTPAAIAENAVPIGDDVAPEPAAALVELEPGELDELRAGPVEEVLPLAPLQQGMLFHTELDAEGVDFYAVQAIADLEGPLDTAAVRDACATLLTRHTALRGYFRRRRNGEPVQLVAESVELPWTEIDLTVLPEQDREAELQRLVDQDRLQRFDLAHPPLVRFTLIRVAAERYRFLWSAHHIATDGWSVPILIDELAQLYAGGATTALPEVPQMRDYLAWLSRQDEEAGRKAWQDLLDGLPGPTRVAPDLPAAANLPATVELALSESDTAHLYAWAREHELTVSTIVQACWAILVGRLAGQQDVVFGAVASGRPAELPGVETMVGMFVNTVPVRARLDPARPVRELLAELGQQQAAMVSYQHIGQAQLSGAIPDSGELFDTAVVFENVPAGDGGPLVMLGEDVRVVDAVTLDSRHYPLSLVVEPHASLVFRFDYLREAFGDDRVRDLAQQFRALLDTVLGDPDRLLGRIDVVAEPTQTFLLGATGPVGAGVVERVRAQKPDAVAVVDDSGSVTYADLVGLASALSRRVPPGRVAGVLAGPGIGFISAVLGVLGAGGAYVPLDPTVPLARLQGLVEDSGAACVIAAPEFRELAANLPVEVIELDGVIDTEPTPVVGVDDDVAYLIFTSGSTGRPKGAMVSRRGMVNHLLAKVEDLALKPSDVLVQNAPLTFDVSVWQMLAPLLVGAQVRAVSRETAADPDALFGLGMSVLEVVPSLLRAALDFWDAGSPPDLTGLRWLVVTGEALPPDLCVRWFGYSPDIPMVNAYGPTECSDDVTHAVLSSVDDAQGLRVPIGLPVRNTRLYVLGDELRPVPPGAAGELYVGGLVVGRGYVGDPGKTGSVFVADPFGEPGTRMYRTGDRVVCRADGALEFVERRDFQVKIRGHRIELGEIEAGLLAQESVTDAVVVVQGSDAANRHLVGYVAGTARPEDLQAQLAELLPAYMVPSAIVVLGRLPLTAHGKVDRKALPAPESLTGQEKRSPRTPVEEQLTWLYAEVLGLPEAGIDDDFFELGGHSLLATALVSRIRSELNVELPLRDLFEARTVAALAGRLASAGQARAAFRKLDRPDPLPLSYAQQRMWFLNRLEGDHGGYTIPLAVRLSGALDRSALAAALDDLTARHEILRTVFPDTDGVPFQRVLDAGESLRTAPMPEDLAAALAVEVARGFDLALDLPLRSKLFGPDQNGDHVLLLVLHHIAGDAWSVDVLARDLATAYEARLSGFSPQWTGLPAQYADYSVWQHSLLDDTKDGESARLLKHWREALAGLPGELALPVDLPRRASAGYHGGTIEFELSSTVHRSLARLAHEQGASLFMVVQAALATLLTRLGAGTDIPLGSLVAGRPDEAVHDLVGFFVNTLVLRTDTSGDPRFTELVARVRDADLAAYAHQDLPFERLLEATQPARSMSRQPLFGVLLSFYDVPPSEVSLGSLTARPEMLAPTHKKFKFDLTFQLGQHKGERGLEGTLEYNADAFTAETAQLLVDRLTLLLTAAAEDPGQPLSRIDLRTPVERVTPAAPALEVPDGLLVPGDIGLREQANRLARALQAQGAGPGETVTVDLPPGRDRWAAIFAVLAIGAAWTTSGPSRYTIPADVSGFADTDLEVSLSGAELAYRGDAVFSRDALAATIAALLKELPLTAGDRLLAPDTEFALPVVLAALHVGAVVTVAPAAEIAELASSVDPSVVVLTPSIAKMLALRPGTRVVNFGESFLDGALNCEGTAASGWLSLVNGRPFAHRHANVLDQSRQPVPRGGRGELYLADAPTGLPARIRLDGTVEVIREAQVRGFAVPLGQIEAALHRQPSVAAAVVIAENDALIAYVVPQWERGVDPLALREALAAELPDYLIPTAFAELDTIPVAPDGSLDRSALPAPTAQTSQDDSETVELLRTAFAETLGIADVDVQTGFFELGGNSLQSVRLVALARRAGLRLTVADVLTHGSIERLAALTERAEPDLADLPDPFAPVLPIRPTGTKPPLFCLHAGLGLSLPYLGLAAHLPDRPIYGLQSPGISGAEQFPDSVEQVAEDYLKHIRRLQPHGPYHLLGWSYGGLLAFEIAVRLEAEGETVGSLSILDSYPQDGTEAALSRHELLVDFLEHVGFHDTEAGIELTPADVIAVLRQGDSRLADIGEDRMTRVLAVMDNNAALAHRYRPTRFTGAVELFVAAEGLTDAEVAERAGRWVPHVSGPVRAHRIECGHEYLMDPGPQAEIGTATAGTLASNEESQ